MSSLRCRIASSILGLLLVAAFLAACESPPAAPPSLTVVQVSEGTVNTAAPSPSASLVPSPTRPLVTPQPLTTGPIDWDKIRNGQTILYWHDGDLWRATADGVRREKLTQDRLLDDWFTTAEEDPWWIGGPPPQPYVSPDGRWLVAPSRGQQWVIVDLSDSKPQRWLPSSAQSVSWSPDSRYIAYGLNKVDIFDVSAGETLEGPERGPGDLEDIVWSPDGQSIAFACCFQPDEQQPGREIGKVLWYNLAAGRTENAGETWRGLGSGTPGLCWSGDRPVPADEAADHTHCSPRHLFPRAESADGLWRAELTEYVPEGNTFLQVSVMEAASGLERFRQNVPHEEPPFGLQRIFWTVGGDVLLLGSYRPGTPIYRLILGEDPTAEGGELEIILNDGVLYGVVPQWRIPPSGQ